MSFFWVAISLGFLGSFHCIGMCGPIALALPIGNLSRINRIISVLVYNGGRIFTYAIFGLFFGSIGQTVALFGYQQILSITLGTLILLSLLIPQKIISKINPNSILYSFFSKLKNKLASLFMREGKKSMLIIGLLNGLLPCGLVYMAVAGSVATASILKGSLFMAVFGLGTLPMMLALPFVGTYLSVSLRGKIRKAIPVFVGMMAIVLILRGLNLGIPYVSPKMQEDNTNAPTCHPIPGKINCSGN